MSTSLVLRIIALVLLTLFTLAAFELVGLSHADGWGGLGLIAWCAAGLPWGSYFHR